MSDEALAFLIESSDRTLQEFELAKRNAAANLRRDLLALLVKTVDAWVDELAEAEVARKVREIRKFKGESLEVRPITPRLCSPPDRE